MTYMHALAALLPQYGAQNPPPDVGGYWMPLKAA